MSEINQASFPLTGSTARPLFGGIWIEEPECFPTFCL